jgi:ATP-dependent RNA helicase DDX47/RRP3
LDIPNVDLVVNMELPLNPKDYIHRVGRTARAGKAGRSVTIVTQYDVENYLRIENLIGNINKFYCILDSFIIKYKILK